MWFSLANYEPRLDSAVARAREIYFDAVVVGAAFGWKRHYNAKQ
jgi:hypothetical protein